MLKSFDENIKYFPYLEAPFSEGAESLPHTHHFQISFNEFKGKSIFCACRIYQQSGKKDFLPKKIKMYLDLRPSKSSLQILVCYISKLI